MSTEKLLIEGGIPLYGEVRTAGAKNAALKILAAALLCPEPVFIQNVPHLNDIVLMIQLVADLGGRITLHDDDTIEIDASSLTNLSVPYSLVKAMRASVVVLGPLLARFHEAKVALPGGCAIGSRPINFHLDGLKAMGADIELKQGFICATVSGRLKGADITMPCVSVTGTENLMMAATLAEGVTTISNAAREPEVQDLAHFLQSMGAKIDGIGTSTLSIAGVKTLHAAKHRVIFDRIEAGTYLIAGAMTDGDVTVRDVKPDQMTLILQKLREAGAKIRTYEDAIHLDMRDRMLRAITIETAPYPGFATDMQAQVMALNTIASGVGMVSETVFENRFMHVAELLRLGANIRVKGDTAMSAGVHRLLGAPVTASDLRASACLVLAGLVAEGVTTIEGVRHMDRGYEFLEEKLSRLGADIRRVVE